MKDIFCKIISGEVRDKGSFLFEDEKTIIIKDINPKARIHYLIIPKKHIEEISDILEEDKELLGHMIFLAKEQAKKEGIDGYKLKFNVGQGGGQEVSHIHLHLLSK